MPDEISSGGQARKKNRGSGHKIGDSRAQQARILGDPGADRAAEGKLGREVKRRRRGRGEKEKKGKEPLGTQSVKTSSGAALAARRRLSEKQIELIFRPSAIVRECH